MAPMSVLSIASLLILFAVADARIPGIYTGGQWESAHATFYGGNDASGTMGTLSILSTFLLANLIKSHLPIPLLSCTTMEIPLCIFRQNIMSLNS